ncbi:MAG: HEPN domain-containing protein [Cytophagaceae bacterium]|jgi:hypothetical protein|nr:HEPN domain-containing protein [Cytophagaceae bacterium]
MPTIIDKQYETGISLIEYLKAENQISLFVEAENNFKKTILLSIASFFEKEVMDTVLDFAKSHSDNNILIISIIKNKAISRQYHTYFEWGKSPNANSFFSLFGEEFKKRMVEKVKSDPVLENSIKSFLAIGFERNKMVHENFAGVTLEKTAEEIFKLYQDSIYFIDTIKIELIKRPSINI